MPRTVAAGFPFLAIPPMLALPGSLRTRFVRSPTRLLPGATALAFLAACGAGGKADGGRGAWAPGQEWKLVPRTTIGAADGEGPKVFAQIVDVELDPLGRVWVADGQQNQIRVFDSAGTHVRSLGRKGGGPEEFNGIAGMDWAADGTLWVLDGGNMRFAVYDTAGRLITTHRRNVNFTVTPWRLGFDARGNLYDHASVTSPDEERTWLVRYGPGLQPRDTFRLPSFPEPVFEVERGEGTNRSIRRVNIPFAPAQRWQLDGQGNVWIAVTDRYRITRYRFDGTVDRVVERAAKPLPVTAEDRRKMLANYGGFERSGGRIDQSRIPRTRPVMDWFFVTSDGHLWVRPFGGKAVLDVFSPNGDYLGQAAVPDRFLPYPTPSVRGDRMAAVVMDMDGVPSVLLLQIEKPGR